MSRTKLLGSMFIVVCCSCGEGDAGDTLSVQQGALATPAPAVVNGSFEDDGTGVASPVGLGQLRLGEHRLHRVGRPLRQLAAVSLERRGVFGRHGADGVRARRRLVHAARVGAPKHRPQQQLRRARLRVRSRSASTCRCRGPTSGCRSWSRPACKHGSCTVSLHTDGDAGEWSNFDDVELVAGRREALGSRRRRLQPQEVRGPRRRVPRRARRGARIARRSTSSRTTAPITSACASGSTPPTATTIKPRLREMARRAQAQGLDVLVDLHYSDSWADPGAPDQAGGVGELHHRAAPAGRLRPHLRRLQEPEGPRATAPP